MTRDEITTATDAALRRRHILLVEMGQYNNPEYQDISAEQDRRIFAKTQREFAPPASVPGSRVVDLASILAPRHPS